MLLLWWWWYPTSDAPATSICVPSVVIDNLYEEIEDLEDEVEFNDEDQQMLDERGDMASMEDLQNEPPK